MSRFKQVVASAFLLGVLWIFLLLSRVLFIESDNTNNLYIPEEAEAVIILNGNHLLEHTFEDVILKTRDNQIIKLIAARLKKTKEQTEGFNIGIDLNSDIILFTLERDNGSFIGVLFNLNDEEAFKTNIPKIIDSAMQGFAATNNVGLILQQSDSTLSKKALNQLSEAILLKSKKLPVEQLRKQQEEVTIASLTITKNADLAPFKMGVDLTLELHDGNIKLEGDVSWDKNAINSKGFEVLKPEGFHFSSSLIPEELNDSLQSYFGSTLPKLTAISFNLMGSELVEQPSVVLVPSMDMILHFEEPTPAFLLTSKLSDNSRADGGQPRDVFMFGGKQFYFKNLSPNVVYIGHSPYKTSKTLDENYLLLAKGDLSVFTKVEGTGMIRRFLEILSIYSAGRDFTERTKNFDLTILKTANGKGIISGEIQFKDGRYATNEVIKLLLNGKLLQ